MSELLWIGAELAKGTVFVFLASVILPIVLFGHLAAVLTAQSTPIA